MARGGFNRYELMRLSFLRRELSWGEGREGKGKGKEGKEEKGRKERKKESKNATPVWSL